MGEERSWMLPEEPAPVRLMATVWADSDGPHDDLAGPSDVDEWLAGTGVDRHGAKTSLSEFSHARELRDSLRRLAAYVTGDDRPTAGRDAGRGADRDLAQAIATVNAAAAEVPAPRLRLAGETLTLTTESAETTVRAALAAVAVEAQHLLAQGSETLRACHAPGCVLYFVRTHHRREWCSIACGNRARAARHYRAVREARTKS
jgi:predicted RNA-binding Zn ribbon-like protein